MPDCSRNLSVIFVNRVYPPDEGATGRLLHELARGLVQRGWEVTVVATGSRKPGPPVGVENPTDPAESVVRVGGLPYDKRSHRRRILSYVSLYPALIWRVIRLRKRDIIVTMTDPPLQLSFGPLVASLKGSALVHWAQDIYPEVAEELGVLRKSGWAANFLRGVSTWALQRQDRIVVVGECMKERLVNRGISAEKMHVIPNWALNSSFPGRGSGQITPVEFLKNHGLTGRFVVMYSGNVGMAHPVGLMVEAARMLQTRQPRIIFVFVGEGAQWGFLQKQAAQLDNVRLLPPQPLDSLHSTLAAADIHLASMHAHLRGLVVPSKIYGIVAAGRPCLFLGPPESEAARFLLRTGAGRILSSTQPQELADCLVRLESNRAEMELFQSQARMAGAELKRDAAVEAFHSLLAGLASTK